MYRKKTQIAKQLKSLELATGWTGMFILKSPDDKSVIHGATDSPMEMNFQHGKPIIDIAFLNQDKKCNKKINMSKIVSKLSKQKRQAQSFVPESPLPSPEKLPDCLRDLAGRQRNTLSDVSLSVLNFSDCSHEIASPVIKRKQGQKKSQL